MGPELGPGTDPPAGAGAAWFMGPAGVLAALAGAAGEGAVEVVGADGLVWTDMGPVLGAGPLMPPTLMPPPPPVLPPQPL